MILSILNSGSMFTAATLFGLSKSAKTPPVPFIDSVCGVRTTSRPPAPVAAIILSPQAPTSAGSSTERTDTNTAIRIATVPVMESTASPLRESCVSLSEACVSVPTAFRKLLPWVQKTLNNQLLDAIRRNCLEDVQSFVARGAHVNASYYVTIEELHEAAKHYTELFIYLGTHGSYDDAKIPATLTPLHCAAHYGFNDIVQWLVENGAEVDKYDRLNRTPLHRTVTAGHVTTTDLLARLGARLETPDADGKTPFIIAAQHGHSTIINLLHHRNATLACTKDKDGKDALWWAHFCRHPVVAQLIFDLTCDRAR